VKLRNLMPTLHADGDVGAALAAIQREREPEIAKAQLLQYREARGPLRTRAPMADETDARIGAVADALRCDSTGMTPTKTTNGNCLQQQDFSRKRGVS
jgi:hypothetical protein